MSQWHEIGPVGDFPEGERKCVNVGKTPICVVHTDGRLHAFLDMCPHAGMPLNEGTLEGKRIICPFHGYTFSIEDGRNLDFDDDVPMRVYPIRVEAGRVAVEM
ncbi:MAG: Rieske 2Fe-2S domain-containing protein [Phycisphaera sp.]|nr:Rieske 2Fe-2S domain-containing protein [Phycisphaera sp.]